MKFVSLSHLLGCPLFGPNFGLFTVPGFIVSVVGFIFKKIKGGRKKRYKGRERRSRTRKKEREKEASTSLKRNKRKKK